MSRTATVTPARTARAAGVFYLITITARIVADGFVRDRLVVSSDAARTATNILAHPDLFRIGFVADVVAFASFVAIAALLYVLLKPVSRSVSLVAALFAVVASIAQAFSSVFHLAALFVLGDSAYLRVFTAEQLQAAALMLLKIRAIGYHNIGLVFLGAYLLLIGWLAYRSTFMPRLVGLLAAIAGLAYMPFLWPPLAKVLLPRLLIPAGIGQMVLMLWLLIAGVNVQRWLERNAASAEWLAADAEPLGH
jgi:hypothetical protein